MTTQPFGRIVDLGAFLKRDLEQLTAEEVKRAHIRVARQLKAEVIADAPVRPGVTTIVDGRQGATEESVRPFGVIAYRFAYWGETLRATIEFARSISPVLSGLYRDSWFALADGVLVTDLNNPPEAEEYIVTNDQPYARVIEVGTKGKKKFRAGVHVAEKTAVAMRQRFGNSVQTSVRFLNLSGSGSGRAAPVPWVTRRGQTVTYPAIVLRPI
jgi:hypothetical protein